VNFTSYKTLHYAIYSIFLPLQTNIPLGTLSMVKFHIFTGHLINLGILFLLFYVMQVYNLLLTGSNK